MPGLLQTRTQRTNQDLFMPTGNPINITAAYQMKPEDHLVRVAAGAVYTVTLPPVCECAGGIYVLRVISGTSIVTFVDKGDARVPVSDTMDANNEIAVLYCDGEMWIFLVTPP